jgi:ubiquinone/menaquinone biosynthesis C-methylase UbiE
VPDHQERKRSQQQLLDKYFHSSHHWKDIHYRAGLYETIYQQRWASAVALLDQLNLRPGARVLEIGCGPGVTTLALAQRGYLVYAVDTVGAMVDSMRQLVSDAGLGNRVRGIQGDIHDLPFPDNYFDAVIVIGVLEWLESWDRPLLEIARVMQPLGSFVGAVNNVWALHCVLDPRLCPLLQPLKRTIRDIQRRMTPSRTLLVEHHHSAREVRIALKKAALYPAAGTTVGFGPFSFLGYTLFHEPLGLRLHRRLQRWADSSVPLLRSMGFVQVFAARKSQ